MTEPIAIGGGTSLQKPGRQQKGRPCVRRGGGLLTRSGFIDYRVLARLFWRAVDALDYWLTQAALLAVDVASGPEPETEADRQWQRAGGKA